MSLAINIDHVSAVLLADGWHEVDSNEGVSSLVLDSYEFIDPSLSHPAHGGGNSGICATGFAFKEKGQRGTIAGPLSAVLAVRYRSS